ncbi:MAG: AraC family transcriptional regulator ligand-binding domain-containing protein, partial [Planctomycetota bacterium]
MRTRSVTVKPLLQHFFSGPEGQDWLDSWARKCGLEPATVDDPHAWLPVEYYYGLFDRIAETSDNPHEEVHLAARRGLSRENLGSLHVLARAFGRPRGAYARYAVYLNSLQNFGKYELHVLQSGAATISFTPREDLPRQELDCIYRRGALEALPTLWRLPTARIGHECCLARGAPNCIYEVKWVPLQQRRISWAASAAGLGIGGLVWGGLAASGVLPTTAALAAATLA